MKLKTSELTGPALDWAVAKCEGMNNTRKNPHHFDSRLIMDGPEGNGVFLESLKYSTDWAQGGPIIERESIATKRYAQGGWSATIYEMDEYEEVEWPKIEGYGNTPLIAAMRCYVALKLGDEVEIPEELI